MKTELLKTQKNIELKPTEATQYVLDLSNDNREECSLMLTFEKPGVEAEIIGLYNLKEGETLNLTTIANHVAPHTKCITTIRGVLYDNTSSKYIGKILIQKDAQQTTSYLDDKILVLGENTKNESQPILEIEADDVRASHGATTGRIDPLNIYYLQSRGLNKEEAEKVIVKGFFESTVSTIADEHIKKRFSNI